MRLGQTKQVKELHDEVMTPLWVCRDIKQFFNPNGTILEPCKGIGNFLTVFPNAEWCEIKEGRDFLNWKGHVDWIITNPPFSKYKEFLEHAITVSDNVVFLAILAKPFYSEGLLEKVFDWGGIVHIRIYGGGSKLDFPIGYVVGAIHFKRGWKGATTFSWFGKTITHETTPLLVNARPECNH